MNDCCPYYWRRPWISWSDFEYLHLRSYTCSHGSDRIRIQKTRSLESLKYLKSQAKNQVINLFVSFKIFENHWHRPRNIFWKMIVLQNFAIIREMKVIWWSSDMKPCSSLEKYVKYVSPYPYLVHTSSGSMHVVHMSSVHCLHVICMSSGSVHVICTSSAHCPETCMSSTWGNSSA